MNAALAEQPPLLWNRRQTRWLVIAVHIAIIGVPPTLTSFGSPGSGPTGTPWVAFPVAGMILLLQLRHSFAIADGHRPPGLHWTFLALVALTYLPIKWFGWYWIAMQICVMASLPLLLRGRALIAATAVPVVLTDIASTVANFYGAQATIGVLIYTVFYWSEVLIAGAVGMYGSARLVRLVEEVQEARASLAEVAVGRERRRISRDLHDLLGQSLSAISLKGDLATRMLPDEPEAAAAEIKSLSALARDALRGILAVSRDQHSISLRSETEGAAALLSVAGIKPEIEVDLPNVSPQVEDILAWTVREGVANALRHSQAHVCRIIGGRRNGHVYMEIVNDGAVGPIQEGGGLSGIRERAEALAGTATGLLTIGGEFRLFVEVPEPRP